MTSLDALQRPEVVAAREAITSDSLDMQDSEDQAAWLNAKLDAFATALVTAVRAERNAGGPTLELAIEAAREAQQHFVVIPFSVAVKLAESPPPDALRRQIEGLRMTKATSGERDAADTVDDGHEIGYTDGWNDALAAILTALAAREQTPTEPRDLEKVGREIVISLRADGYSVVRSRNAEPDKEPEQIIAAELGNVFGVPPAPPVVSEYVPDAIDGARQNILDHCNGGDPLRRSEWRDHLAHLVDEFHVVILDTHRAALASGGNPAPDVSEGGENICTEQSCHNFGGHRDKADFELSMTLCDRCMELWSQEVHARVNTAYSCARLAEKAGSNAASDLIRVCFNLTDRIVISRPSVGHAGAEDTP